jgi:hypothetical protein
MLKNGDIVKIVSKDDDLKKYNGVVGEYIDSVDISLVYYKGWGMVRFLHNDKIVYVPKTDIKKIPKRRITDRIKSSYLINKL